MHSMPMQSGMVAQYGGNQYTSQQAAGPTSAFNTLPARPTQQAAQASTYSATPYNRPAAQPRSAATPAAPAPAFGRPSVQAPAGNRAAVMTRPATQPAAAKAAVPAAPAGKANLCSSARCIATTTDASAMASHLTRPLESLHILRLRAAHLHSWKAGEEWTLFLWGPRDCTQADALSN